MYQFSLTWFQRTFHSCILDRDTTRRMSMTNLMIDSDPLQRLAKQRRRSSLLSSVLHSPRHSISEDYPSDQLPMNASKVRRNTKPFVSTVNPQQRESALRTMVDRLTFTIYQLVSWSLFAEHQFLFSFLLTTTIEREMTKNRRSSRDQSRPAVIQEEENDEIKPDEEEVETKQSIITKDEWTCFMSPLLMNVTEEKLSFVKDQLPSLYPICQDLLLDTTQEFFTHANPYLYLNRHDNYSHLSRFQTVLLVKILRPELLLPSISQYVIDQMGSKFLSSGFADIQDIYTHSSPQVPIILLLSPGQLNRHLRRCSFYIRRS